MICRRHTIGFVQIVRGKFEFENIEYIQKIVNVLTDREIEMLKDENFENLWEELWFDEKYNKTNEKTINNMKASLKKFLILKNGFVYNGNCYDLYTFLNNRPNIHYNEPEWGFPKGRRNHYESDLSTALRECYEETGVNDSKINYNPMKLDKFVEEYISYDNITYRNIYFLCEYNGNDINDVDENKREQYAEVSKIQFLDLDECLSKIRDYDIEKRKLIVNINNKLINKNDDNIL
jgi:8-oxo-dGTP pyrophosphatase MutT (NUDIX family)